MASTSLGLDETNQSVDGIGAKCELGGSSRLLEPIGVEDEAVVDRDILKEPRFESALKPACEPRLEANEVTSLRT